MSLPSPTPPRAIVKIGCDGRLYLNYKAATIDQLQSAVEQLNRDGGFIVYYPESPFHNASDAAMATFKQLLEFKPRILMANKAPSEWGRLDWVEVQRNPAVSRFFVARGQKFLISAPTTPEQPQPQVLVGGPLSSTDEDALFKHIDLAVRSDRIVETAPHDAQLAMDEAACKTASLHIRLRYTSRAWAAAYDDGQAPDHIEAFYRDLWWLAERAFRRTQSAARPISGHEALSHLRDRPATH